MEGDLCGFFCLLSLLGMVFCFEKLLVWGVCDWVFWMRRRADGRLYGQDGPSVSEGSFVDCLGLRLKALCRTPADERAERTFNSEHNECLEGLAPLSRSQQGAGVESREQRAGSMVQGAESRE